MPQWVIHRDVRWFDDPEAFRPERWEGGLMQRIASLRLLPVWRRAQDLHRQQFRPDGSGAGPGDGGPEVSAAARG